MNERRNKIHFQIYLGLLMAMAVSLPLSKALMSIVPGFLMLNWLTEGQFAQKLKRLKEHKSVALLVSVFFVYLVGLLWTSSLKWGLHDLKIQLPLLVLPLVIGTSAPLDTRQLKRIIYVFSAAVVAASLCSIWVLLGLSGKKVGDPRELSLFISHIRFALLINIGIFSLGYYFFDQRKRNNSEKALLGVGIIWLAIFLVILKSATGWVVFLVVLPVVIFRQVFRIKKMVHRILISGAMLFILLLPIGYVAYVVKLFYTVQPVPENIATEHTAKGNPYLHDFNNKELENGNYTYLYINEKELRDAWMQRSNLPYDSVSPKGFNRFVLVRYLTSKGLRKDAGGVWDLTDGDIRNIENGMTNYKFASSSGFFTRIYQVIWELDIYRKGGNPSGHSVTQRIEYYKMAVQIIAGRFWFGHGTGGYYEAYQDAYNQNRFFKDQQYRQRSHNMFLSYWIDFGLVGLLYICTALFAPVFMERKAKSYLLLVFLLIVLISFVNEDTLNNHDAISFFVFFYPLYLYSNPSKSPRKWKPL